MVGDVLGEEWATHSRTPWLGATWGWQGQGWGLVH